MLVVHVHLVNNIHHIDIQLKLVIQLAHLTQPPHHGQLEVLVVHRLVRAAGEGEAVGDLQLGVGHQPQQRALGDAAAAGAGLQLVAVLDQLHDHQAVNLDNLRGGDIFR